MRDDIAGFAEAEGQLLTLTVFLLVGAVLLPAVLGGPETGRVRLDAVRRADLAYAAASLTVVRMLPVALCLAGKGLSPWTVAFLGWFGPRGLASVIYLLILIDEYALAEAEAIAPTVLATVLLSVVLHGVSAAPLSRAYGRSEAASGAPEQRDVHAFPPLDAPRAARG